MCKILGNTRGENVLLEGSRQKRGLGKEVVLAVAGMGSRWTEKISTAILSLNL